MAASCDRRASRPSRAGRCSRWSWTADAHGLLLQRPARDGQPITPTRQAFSAALRVEGSALSPGVTFLPHGMSSGARFGVETVGARAYVITVDALTGRVSTQRVAR